MIEQLAKKIDDAAHTHTSIEQLSKQHRFSEQEAYAIQAASIQNRYNRGEHLIGLKLGFTSRAKMKQMGVHDMIWGRLTNTMLFEEGDTLSIHQFIHPRAEPEICFLIKQKIEKQLNLLEAKNYIEAIAPAIEIIDSRFKNFKFSLEDVIADNCSSAGVIIGKWQKPTIDCSNLGMALCVNQKPVHLGSSAAILGNPLRSFAAATRLAHQYEETIEAGHIILAGAATPAVYIQPGQYISAEVEKLGTVGIKMVD